jgi:hypothetical protein
VFSKPPALPAMTVLGSKKNKASRQPAQILDSHAQSNRSATLVRGLVGHLL